MKKHLFAAIAIILWATPCFSQTRKVKLSLSIGPSIAAGSFASTAFNDSKAGYAKTGAHLQLGFGYGLSNKLDVTATVLGALNGVNTKAMASQLSQVGLFGRNYPNWSFEKKNWQTAALLVGAATHLPLGTNNKLTLTIHPALGVAYAKAPELNGDSKTDTSYVVFHTTSASGFGLGYMLSAGLGYKLSGHIQLSLTLQYFGTSAITFKNVSTTIAATNGGLNIPGVYSINNSKSPPMAQGITSSSKQAISTITPLVSIHFML